MGMGDAILAAGAAKLAYDSTGDKIAIGNGRVVLWNPLYQYNPYLVRDIRRERNFIWLRDHPGNRGYIDHPATKAHPENGPGPKDIKRWIWDFTYSASPAEIYFTRSEQELIHRLSAEPYVTVEPNIKTKASPAKDWPFEYYQDVVNALTNHIRVYQLLPKHGNQRRLNGVTYVKCDIRQAACYLKSAKCRTLHM